MPYSLIKTPQFQPFDLPFIGDDIAKIGRIIDLYKVPCTPTGEIWVYGFFQAIPTLFISILKPELIDINIRHRRGRPRKGKRLKFIAAALFRDALISIPVPRWVVFRIYEWTQRIGWYLLIADATEQFAINWMSLAYKYQGCQSLLRNYVHRTGAHVLMGGGASGGPSQLGFDTNISAGFNFPGSLPQPASNGIYRVSWTAEFTPYQNPAQSKLPVETYLYTDGLLSQKSLVLGADFDKQTSSGGGEVFAISAIRPRITAVAKWDVPNKFCYVKSVVSIDREDQSKLEPDP